jgi:predicted ATP-grasp superfamily ATP-dependent carboligase
MGSSPRLPTALILGGDVNGLGVARSLGQAGVPMMLLDTDPARPTMQTRHGGKSKIPALSGEDFVTHMIALSDRFAAKPVLIPTQEATVATLSAARARLAPHYVFALPEDGLVRALLDKTGFQVEAERLGFAVPKSRALVKGADVPEDLRYPCVLKPAVRDAGYGHRFAKAYRLERREDASALWRDMQSVIDRAILQEWIDGGDSDIYFCLQYRPPSGAAATAFCGRKTLQWPPRLGGTATCIPAPETAALLSEQTSSFFAKVGFTGLCSMEYKRDTGSGIFYMIEPTVGRTDYQEEIASLNGVNIPLAAYCDLAGMPADAVHTSRNPVGWRDPFGHHQALAAGAADPAETLLSGGQILDAYFRLDDPMPFLATKWAALRRRFSSGAAP